MSIIRPVKDRNGLTLDEFLKEYDVTKYERPSCTADVALFTLLNLSGTAELAVLLIKRKDHPNIGAWGLPGGFINMDEELITAAERELYEETGVEGVPLRQFGTFGQIDRDPRTRVVSTGFFAVAPMGSINPKAGDDAIDAALYVVETCLEAATVSAETYRITLFGNRILIARAQLRYDELGSVPAPILGAQAGDLAGDHSHLLFSAMHALAQLPRNSVAKLLTKNSPEFYKEATNALERALSAIPTQTE